MPAFQALPLSVRVCGVVGYLEVFGLAAYAVSIAFFELAGSTAGIAGDGAQLAPPVLIALFLVFALLVLLVTTALLRGSRRALTPSLLTQAFGVVIGWTLVDASGTRALGLGVLSLAAVGLAALLSPAARGSLQ